MATTKSTLTKARLKAINTMVDRLQSLGYGNKDNIYIATIKEKSKLELILATNYISTLSKTS